MFFNFIKIAFRNIKRHKLFSFINIFSLMLSLTIGLAALMIIKNQLSFDDFHPHPDRTYRVITEAVNTNNRSVRWATTPLPLGERLQENYDVVEATARFHRTLIGKATAAGKKLSIRGSFTDPTFFDIFGFELQSGNPATVLSDPFSVVLTQKTAQRFFGDENPMGKTFTVEGMGNFKITGVLKPLPHNTHLQFGLLGSMGTLSRLENSVTTRAATWHNYTISHTYLLTKPNTNPETLKENLAVLGRQVSGNFELGEHIQSYAFDIQALEDITPGEELRGDIGAGKSRSALELLSMAIIALVILLMACFNYTNLSIARALKRAREVGMYKILGAARSSIVFQFIIQAVLISLASMVLAYSLLPFIPLPPGIMEEVQSVTPGFTLIIWFILFAVFTGLLAGGLPAWILSTVEPVKMLKNFKNLSLIEGLTLRKTLVVGQFALSLILIIAAMVIYRQSQFAATTDYGFQRENIINLELQGTDHKLLKDELSQTAGVKQISATSRPFGTFASGRSELQIKKSDPIVRARSYSVSSNVVDNLNLNVVAGSTFPESVSPERESHILINEQLLALMNWESPSEAVGQSVWLDDSLQVEIAGVLKDFHFEAMSRSIDPLVLRYNPEKFNYLSLSVASSNTENAVESMSAVWKKVAPTQPIDYHIYDEYLYETHAQERDVASIGFYALIAISIACLGLLGMVTYTVEVRTQEVGIRKVLGAGVGRIILLLSKEFIWLLVFAALIGLPVGYWIGMQFLDSYAYHITIGLGTLTAGLGLMLLVGLIAIGMQTWQIARANPIDSIRSEG